MATRNSSSNGRASRGRAFTLVEMLIVCGIITMIIAMALPLFNAISGSKSIEQTKNVIASMLGRARQRAMGLQQNCGVVFWTNPQDSRVFMALVGPDPAAGTPSTPYIDFAPSPTDYELEKLPQGVGLQTLYNCGVTAPTTAPSATISNIRTSDGYVSGPCVIMFDSHGMLTAVNYKIFKTSVLGTKLNLPSDFAPGVGAISQFGFVLYDGETFNAQGFDAGRQGVGGTYAYIDTVFGGPAYGSSTSASPTDEAHEEAWLDNNSTPVLINRYNGTLYKSEFPW